MPAPPTSPAPATRALRQRRFQRRAFTLIELIVVVIIIAILAAIAGTAYNRYVGDARDTAVLASAKQVDTAITAQSAREDLNPGEVVAAGLADPAGLKAHLRVTGEDLTLAADHSTAPTTVQVSHGTRHVCLTLGDAPGKASTLTHGECGTVTGETTVSYGWSAGTALITPRRLLGATIDSADRIYIGGGYTNSGSTLTQVERYDPSTSTWSPLPSTGIDNLMRLAKDGQGRIYAVGNYNCEASSLQSGGSGCEVRRYDDTTNAWTTVAGGPGHQSAEVASDASGRIYTIGGYTGTGSTTRVDRYDPGTDTWTAVSSMRTARRSHAAATDADGRIYAIGGMVSNGVKLATVERYDPTTGSWTDVAPMPVARLVAAATTDASGRIVVVGGRHPDGTTLATVERYDPTTDTWETMPSLSQAVEQAAAVTDSAGRLWALGGAAPTPSEAVTTVQVFGPQP